MLGRNCGCIATCGWTGGIGSSEWVARGPSGPVMSLGLSEAVGAIGVLAWEGLPTAMCRVGLGRESEIQEEQWNHMLGFMGQAHAVAGAVELRGRAGGLKMVTDWM